MSDQKPQPVDLAEQLDVIEHESAIAQKRLPKLATPIKGREPKMSWGAVNRRIGGYRAAARTLKVLNRWRSEGRLPPELLQELEAPL